MIQDLDGATTEPSRRRHVAVLSASTAVLAMAMFYVLVAPPNPIAVPQAAAPSPSPSIGLTIFSNPLVNMPVEMRSALCAEAGPLDEPARPTPMTWASFRLSVDATRGPAFPVVIYDQTGSRPVAFVSVEQGTGGFIVTCATPDRSAPRPNRAR